MGKKGKKKKVEKGRGETEKENVKKGKSCKREFCA